MIAWCNFCDCLLPSACEIDTKNPGGNFSPSKGVGRSSIARPVNPDVVCSDALNGSRLSTGHWIEPGFPLKIAGENELSIRRDQIRLVSLGFNQNWGCDGLRFPTVEVLRVHPPFVTIIACENDLIPFWCPAR